MTVSETFSSYDSSKWDIPKQRDPSSTSAVKSRVGLSSVPSCAGVTEFTLRNARPS